MIKEIINNEEWIDKLLKVYKINLLKLRNNPFVHVLGYEDKGVLVYSKIYDRIEIDYIIVNDIYQNKGIGTLLLNYMINNNKVSNITLEVRESNYKAIKFYEKNGFVKCSIRDKYYGDENGLLMIRRFNSD